MSRDSRKLRQKWCIIFHQYFTHISTTPVNYLKTIRAATNGRFKINVSFGFILKHRATEELRFFHPSNNTLLFETPMLVANETDFTSLLDRMEREDALEYARQQRPSTNWTVERVICVRFDVYRLTNI